MADQIDRLIFQVTGQDRGGGKVLSDTAKHADAAHQSMSKLSSTLTGLGGPFEQVTSLASNLGDAFDGAIGKTAKLGLGLAAAGVALIAFGAKDQQAQRQLQQTVDNTGQSYADYRDQIDEAIKSQERNAHTADDTQNALNTLTTANQDVTKSLSEMAFVADLAAKKHEDLAVAAQQLVLMESGNTRAFRSFGITLDTTKDRATEVDKALHTLQDRLSGQASSAVDTTTGKFKVWGVELEDTLARLGKYGPALTVVGAGLTAYAATLQIAAARKVAETATTVAETEAETANAAARLRTADAAAVETAAIQRATIAQAENAGASAGRMGMVGRLGKGALIGGLGYYGATTVGNAVGGTSGRYLGDIGGGAAIGAGLGSVVPGVGTLVGAGVGAAVGLGSALLHSPAPASGGSTVAQTEAGYQKAEAALAKLQAAAAHSTGMLHQAQEAAIKDAQAALKAGQANHEYATALIKQQVAAVKSTNTLEAHMTALEANVKAGMDLATSEDGVSTAMHNLAQSVHDGSTALEGNSTSAINNRAALRDVVSQEMQVLQAMRDHHVSADKVAAAARAMSRAIEKNATDMGLNRRQVHLLLGDLHVLPGEIYNALAPAASLSEQVGENIINGIVAGIEVKTPEAMQAAKIAAGNISKSAAITFGVGGEGSGPQTAPGPDPKQKKSAKDYGQSVADSVIAGYAPAVDTGVNAATQKALDKAKQRLQALASLEKQAAQQIASAYQSTKQSLVDAASLANRPEGTDLLGASGPAASILASKRQFAHQMIHFARLIHRLEEARYNPTVIDEVEGLGTVAGIEAAQELLAGGRKERRAVNRAERRIERAAGRISSTITSQDYNAEILKTLQKLPSDFDRKFEHTLRKLHIITDTGSQDRKQGHRVRTH